MCKSLRATERFWEPTVLPLVELSLNISLNGAVHNIPQFADTCVFWNGVTCVFHESDKSEGSEYKEDKSWSPRHKWLVIALSGCRS